VGVGRMGRVAKAAIKTITTKATNFHKANFIFLQSRIPFLIAYNFLTN
jgi:hypothetical protein